VIITSRLSDWSGSAETVELELLSEDAAVEFLLERTKNRRVNDPSDPDRARELAKELEGLALGLDQAGAFINQMRCSFDDYLRRWHAREQKVRAWHNARLMLYPLSMAVTWDASFEQLGWAARQLLNLLCWLAPEPVPRALTAGARLRKEDAANGASAEEGDPEEALAEVAGFSMLKWETGNQAFRIHRLVWDVIRERQPDEQRSVILQSALLMVDSYLPDDPPADDVRSWPIWEPMVAHVRGLISEAAKSGIGQPTSRLANGLAIFIAVKSLWPEAEALARLALEIDEQMLGSGHPNVANRLNNLAHLLKETNRLTEAEPLMWRALSIDEKSYGSEHPNVAIHLGNLAQLLQDTNRLSEAEPLMWRALSIDEKSYGVEHPHVARDLNNLAQLLKKTNRLTEAEPLMWRALSIDEKSYGSEHPNVAIHLGNLAQLLKDTNRLSEAEPLMRRALSIDEKSYGVEHPRFARDLSNLAVLFKATNRLSEAEPLYRRALAIAEKSYGPEHPTVALCLSNLALLLQDTNRLSEAEPLSRRSLQIVAEFGRRTGHEHPHFRTAINTYAGLLAAMDLNEQEIRDRVRSLRIQDSP